MINNKNQSTFKKTVKQNTETTLLNICLQIKKLPNLSRERKIFDNAWQYAMRGVEAASTLGIITFSGTL